MHLCCWVYSIRMPKESCQSIWFRGLYCRCSIKWRYCCSTISNIWSYCLLLTSVWCIENVNKKERVVLFYFRSICLSIFSHIIYHDWSSRIWSGGWTLKLVIVHYIVYTNHLIFWKSIRLVMERKYLSFSNVIIHALKIYILSWRIAFKVTGICVVKIFTIYWS